VHFLENFCFRVPILANFAIFSPQTPNILALIVKSHVKLMFYLRGTFKKIETRFESTKDLPKER
jgi:predicted LPLAT superfamily acyltransferase